LFLIAVVTDALVAASRIEALLCACVMTCGLGVTLVDVDARPTIRRQRVAEWTRADERAGSVATVELTRRRTDRLTLVHVHTLTLTLSHVHLDMYRCTDMYVHVRACMGTYRRRFWSTDSEMISVG